MPTAPESVAELVNEIVDALKAGKNAAIHCRQGIGRSALIVGSIFVIDGTELSTALKLIEESRGVEVPETAEQRQWLSDFASWVLAEYSAQPATRPGGRSGG